MMKILKKCYLAHENKIIFLALYLFLATMIFELAIYSFEKFNSCVDNFIYQEQRESYEKIEKNINESENNLNELKIKLEEIRKTGSLNLNDKERGEILDILNRAENDFLKIENGIKSYRSDMSIQFYPRKNMIIEEKIDNAWGLSIATERLVRNIEGIVFAEIIYGYQVEAAQENLEKVFNKFEKIK